MTEIENTAEKQNDSKKCIVFTVINLTTSVATCILLIVMLSSKGKLFFLYA